MKLVVFSHKPCWKSPDSPSGYATDGGFPLQMQAISELFDFTTLLVPIRSTLSPKGIHPLTGHNVNIYPLDEPYGHGLRRKISFLFWLPRNFIKLWNKTKQTDAVHSPVPGDIGTIGVLIALVQCKPLFVRHCGNWYQPRTLYERWLKWFLEKIAGGKNVVLATGGSNEQPSRKNSEIKWVFATSLRQQELDSYSKIHQLKSEKSPKLIIVCRQEWDKGIDVVIKSIPLLLKHYPNITLDVVGDGTALEAFIKLARDLNISNNVWFHGGVNHKAVMGLLCDADLFCYPTASEGFPKVVLEAMACGLPVVTTPVSVLPMLVSEKCGILLDEVNPEELSKAVVKIFTDPDLYREMSRNAYIKVQDYSLDHWGIYIKNQLDKSWGKLRTDV